MRAQLKNWYASDIEDLANYYPAEPDNFCFQFRALVGPQGAPGEESFDIQICTPRWLLGNMQEDDIILGRHYLIVREYDFKRILSKITRLIENCWGDTWHEVAAKVSRIGYWEFEDYRETNE